MSAALTRFGGSVLDRLDAKIAARPTAGLSQATRLALSLIDEDPEQPRREFDPAALEQLAASIRMVGVLQPVGVAAAADGRYLLRWGARRLRASKLAGLQDIPAVLVADGQGDLVSQLAENALRVPNSDTEIAAAIDTLTERGFKNAEIAITLALSDPQSVKHYRVLHKLHETAPPLVAWVNRASARTLYELESAWQRMTAEELAALVAGLEHVEELTITAARRLIAACAEVAMPAEAIPPIKARDLPAEPIKARGLPDAGKTKQTGRSNLEAGIAGAIGDFANSHPDAFTPRGRELMGSLAKRIAGSVLRKEANVS